MGQRLVLTVFDDNKRLCNIYFHWSAYTVSAFEELDKVIELIEGKPTEGILVEGIETKKNGEIVIKRKHVRTADHIGVDDLVLRIAIGLSVYGGGFDQSDREEVIKRYGINAPFATSRNEGMIAISEKEMNEIERWGEGNAYIDISTKTCRNDCFFLYSDIKEYLEMFERTYAEPIHCPYCLDAIPYSDVEKCSIWFNKIPGDALVEWKGDLYSMIC